MLSLELATSLYKMSEEVLGYYQSIESFGLVDGPGVRSILFLQGCPFRCLYCHNPDTWQFNHSQPISPSEAFKKLVRFKTYWKEDGGITISGGEPLAQIDFLIELAKICKENNINVTIDTSGACFSLEEPFISKFNTLLKYIDLIMLDIKCIDEDIHKKITGHSNKNVIEMFEYLSKVNFPIWVRHVLVPNLTDNDELLIRTRDFLKKLNNIQRVEVLPYHTLGVYKYEKLNLPYKLKDVNPPSDERVDTANKILEVNNYQGYLKK